MPTGGSPLLTSPKDAHLDRGRQLAELPCCVKHPESFTAANPCAPTCDGWGDIPWAHGKVLGCTVWMLLSVTNSSAATAKGAYTCLRQHRCGGWSKQGHGGGRLLPHRDREQLRVH